MTDRHTGYIVTLAEDVREDDADEILAALRMIRSVLSVEPLVSGWEVHAATERVRHEYALQLGRAISGVLAVRKGQSS